MNMHSSSFVTRYSLRAASIRKRVDALISLSEGSMALKRALWLGRGYACTINKLAARRAFERSRELRLSHV